MFGPDVDAAAKAHAIAQYPKECCGVVVSGAKYIPIDNLAADPENEFKLPASALAEHAPVMAVVHSHCYPKHGPEPSALDMASQIEAALPFGIVWTNGETAGDPTWWGDFRLDEPLFDAAGNHIPRRFFHAVHDCYSLIRAWYWQVKKIKLPDFPRDKEWMIDGGDLYQEGFSKAGFACLAQGPNPPALEVGDVVLMRFGKIAVPFHGGVLLDNGLLLHHPATLRNPDKTLSRREPLGRWTRCATHWLRYKGAQICAAKS